MSIVGLISRAEKNRKWLNLNYKHLTERYNDKWVAILDQDVIDHDMDLKRLVKRLRKRLDKKYPEVGIEYITKKSLDMILVVSQ